MNFFNLLTVCIKICTGLFAFTLPVILMASTPAQAQSCNAPAPGVVTTVNLPGTVFSAGPTEDGCTIFVSMAVAQDRTVAGHIAVLGRKDGKITLLRDILVPNQLFIGGIALSHDGKLLAATNRKGVLLFEVGRLMAGDGKPIIEAKDDPGTKKLAGSGGVAISPDDKLLFVSDEDTASITLYDLAKLRGGNANAVGRIPVGEAPTRLVFSPDGRKLYSINEYAQPDGAPVTCLAPDGVGGAEPQGLLTVVDVARAAGDPADSVLARVPSGCDSVGIALSGDGARAFVTNRSANSLLEFDTSKLLTDPTHALIAGAVVGNAPVGVAAALPYIVTADSNRLAPAGRKSEWLSVIDPVTFKVIGNIPAGLFPRDLSVTADSKTLLVVNANSNTIELVDLERLTPTYFAQEKPVKDADDAEQAEARAMLAARIKSHQAAPGTEAALRHLIESFASGKPDYKAMGSQVAIFSAIPARIAQVQRFGALQSIAFKSTSRNGVDEFEVTFQHAKTDWGISLSADGKAAILGIDAVR